MQAQSCPTFPWRHPATLGTEALQNDLERLSQSVLDVMGPAKFLAAVFAGEVIPESHVSVG
ncbi:MAG: hypothetical protein ACRDNF_10770 [Streptosporangiaceae bacterium]